MVAVDRVVIAHCQVLQIPKPTIKWGDELSQGAHFAPATAGDIELGRGIAYHEFGSMMTMVLHETTHHHQQGQVNQVKAQQPVPFPTQVAIFGASISAYVDGTEDQVGYRDQPIEAHAFMAGGHAATLLMRGLDRLEASRT